MFRRSSIFLLLAGAAMPALAQQPAPQDNDVARQTPPPGEDDYHAVEAETIIVTADYVRELDILAGKSVLQGEDLVEDIRPQIGDTLTDLPGVSATSFAPGASRPVLRGFQGPRIRVLTDGIGTIDVSITSADHAVTVDPLTAERIEVLQGPAVLLFGSQAIGGAVNVLDRRIPRRIPDEPAHVVVTGALASAADERSIGGAFDVPLGAGFVFHLDGSWRDTDDLEVGGFVLSEPLRAEQLEIAEEELEEGHEEEAEEALEFADLKDVLPNSATETRTLGAGLGWIRGDDNIGVSVGWYETDYGVPTRPGAGHHHGEEEEEEENDEEEHEEEEGHGHGEEPVSIALDQLRVDARAQFGLGGFFERVRLRGVYADYEHTEFEGDEVGTVFRNEGLEGRIELVQADRDGWRGVIGAQGFLRDFEAVGPEAFVPPNETSQYGLFTLQEFAFGRTGLELALRYEHAEASSDSVLIGDHEDGATVAVDRGFDAFSAAAGISYDVAPQFKVGLNASRVERAPSAEELFSNGPHIATQAFEIGDPEFVTEKSLGLEAYARGLLGPVRLGFAAFASWFDDYIYEIATGEEEDELPVFRFRQDDATYYGFEFQFEAPLHSGDALEITADGVADFVRATIEENDMPVPRIPPLRLLGGLEARSGALGGRVEVEWVAEQDRVAPFELPTDSFTLVNASLSWRPFGEGSASVLIASVENIFDVEARRHASFTKDFVPLPGRDFRLSARLSF
ncbi:MAG: TonB-dependent receptor [Sphingomonadaceae bacterium]